MFVTFNVQKYFMQILFVELSPSSIDSFVTVTELESK